MRGRRGAKGLRRPRRHSLVPRHRERFEQHGRPGRAEERADHHSRDRGQPADEREEPGDPHRRPADRREDAHIATPGGDEQPEEQPFEQQPRRHDEAREREKEAAERG